MVMRSNNTFKKHFFHLVVAIQVIAGGLLHQATFSQGARSCTDEL